MGNKNKVKQLQYLKKMFRERKNHAATAAEVRKSVVSDCHRNREGMIKTGPKVAESVMITDSVSFAAETRIGFYVSVYTRTKPVH